MRPRHWDRLLESMDQPPYPEVGFSLGELLDMGALSQVRIGFLNKHE
jgi:hypothetical protein